MKNLFSHKALGLQPAPFDAWLTLRGLKTLPLRMAQHEHNALAVAQFLESHPAIAWVRHPMLPSHPQHELAKQQMSGGSGLIICGVKAAKNTCLRIAQQLRLFTLAESLGGVESLACHPATMTHASVPADVRAAVGIDDNLLRFSVGCEDSADLIADLSQALAQALAHSNETTT